MTARNVPAQRRTIDRRIVGTPEYVRDAIRVATASGRLVHVSPWQETREGVQVTVRLLDAPRTATAAFRQQRRRSRRVRPAIVAAAGVGTTALGVAAYAAVQLVNAIVAALPVIGGGLLLLALVALLRGGRSRTFTFTGTGRMD